MRLIFFLLLTLPLYAKPNSGFYTNPELDELRIELDDIKHALKSTQVELGLLDERLKKQDKVPAQPKDSGSLTLLTAQVNTLEKKVVGLEKTLEKAANDLRALSAASTKIQEDLFSHEKRLDEVGKLKGTLTNISKAIGQRETPSSTKSYRVKAGDSLEKIARNQRTTVEIIQKINHLSNDRIIVGQELRLPDDPN